MILPPPIDDEPEPIHYKTEPVSNEQAKYIKERLSHPAWLCPSCGLNNHHFNRSCARCKCPKSM